MKKHDVVQNSDDWYILRSGKPSASMFGQIITEKALLKDEIVAALSVLGDPAALKKLKIDDLKAIAADNRIGLTPNLVLAKTDYAEQLAAETLAGHDVDSWLPELSNVHMQHGHDSEYHAIQYYEAQTGNKCEQIGFVTDDNETYGCSPDQLVNNDGLLEIKSPPWKERD